MNIVDGIDISFSEVPAAWAVARWNEGNRIFVQDLQTGGRANDATLAWLAPKNLRTFREAGYVCGGYANANPGTEGWLTGPEIVSRAKTNAGNEWPNVSFIVVDFEIEGTTWGRVFELVDLFRTEGKDCRIIYTGKWVVDAAGQPDPGEFAAAACKLWTTGQRAYAPWTQDDIVGMQLGETVVDGITYDYDKFDLDFFTAQPESGDGAMLYIRFEDPNSDKPYEAAVFAASAAELVAVYDGSLIAPAQVTVIKKGTPEYEKYKALPVRFQRMPDGLLP